VIVRVECQLHYSRKKLQEEFCFFEYRETRDDIRLYELEVPRNYLLHENLLFFKKLDDGIAVLIQRALSVVNIFLWN